MKTLILIDAARDIFLGLMVSFNVIITRRRRRQSLHSLPLSYVSVGYLLFPKNQSLRRIEPYRKNDKEVQGMTIK